MFKTILSVLGVVALLAGVFADPTMVAKLGPTLGALVPFIGALALALGRALSPIAMGKPVAWTAVALAVAGVAATYSGLLGNDVGHYAALVVAMIGALSHSPLDKDGDGVPDVFEQEE